MSAFDDFSGTMEMLKKLQESQEHYRKMMEIPLYETAPPPEIKSLAEIQFEVVKEYVQRFQETLDDTHDVGLLLTDFGQSVLMSVTGIACEPPSLMVFRGFVGDMESTLIQNVNRLNFLITTVQKEPEKPHNVIGFTVAQEDKPPTNP